MGRYFSIHSIFLAILIWAGALSHAWPASAAPKKAQITLEELFHSPAVIGDSISQGFFAATLETRTQDWAFPVLVTKQAGQGQLRYNQFRGPYINLQRLLQLECGPICLAREMIGTVKEQWLPNQVAVSGADYSNVLYSNSRCEDIRSKTCKQPDKYHRWTLGTWGTQMEIIERLRPSFLFLNAAANHVLCVALSASLKCLDEERFLKDFAETVRRVKAIGTIKGGLMFTVPDVTSVKFLEPYNDPQGRPQYSGLKPFISKKVEHPDQVLDPDEIRTARLFLKKVNDEIRRRAAELNFAVADLYSVFNNIKAGQMRVEARNGFSPGIIHASWPMPGEPGVFGLDGVHPNQLGHALIANQVITAINEYYALNENGKAGIEKVDEYAAWYFDSLNQKPVRLQQIVNSWGLKTVVQWLIDLLRPRSEGVFGNYREEQNSQEETLQ